MTLTLSRCRLLLTLIGLILPLSLHAKVAKPVREQLEARFPPAVAHAGLLAAQEPLDPAKLRGFVVLEKDGIPAGRAFWFISNQEYDYLPVVIAGDTLSVRRGTAYTFLQRGQVMAIAGVEWSGNTVYIKLLSRDHVMRTTQRERHPSRVAVMLGFKLPKATMEGDADTVQQTIETWLKPFPDRASAEAYATQYARPTR